VFHTPTPPWRRSGNLADPDLLYARKPGQRLRLRFEGSDRHGLRDAPPAPPDSCDVTLDGLGFRNPPGLEAARVVLVGDSFVEGLQVRDDELVSARLAERLGAPVANLGRTGYGPRQELAVLERYAAKFAPRTCVWFFYEGNDLQDLHEYDANQKNLRYILDERRAESGYGRSFVRNGLGFAIRNWLRPDPTRPAEAYTGLFSDRKVGRTPIYFGTGIQHGSGGPEFPRGKSDELKRVRGILADARALCRENGVELVVAFVPAKLRVYRDFCAFAPDSPCVAWPSDDLPGDFRRLVEGLGPDVGFVDLTGPFRASAEAGGLAYLPPATPWCGEGHRRAGAGGGAMADAQGSTPSTPIFPIFSTVRPAQGTVRLPRWTSSNTTQSTTRHRGHHGLRLHCTDSEGRVLCRLKDCSKRNSHSEFRTKYRLFTCAPVTARDVTAARRRRARGREGEDETDGEGGEGEGEDGEGDGEGDEGEGEGGEGEGEGGGEGAELQQRPACEPVVPESRNPEDCDDAASNALIYYIRSGGRRAQWNVAPGWAYNEIDAHVWTAQPFLQSRILPSQPAPPLPPAQPTDEEEEDEGGEEGEEEEDEEEGDEEEGEEDEIGDGDGGGESGDGEDMMEG
ncbi:hypothetical protein HK102_006400, partial [Quaeritorhiza haematococci]